MINLTELTGKQIIVTGASSGIGRACAILISRCGGKIIATGRNPDRINQTLSNLEGDGHHGASFDLSDADATGQWMLDLAKEHGKLDGLVHMAGIHRAKPLKVSDPEFVEELLSVNVGSAIALARGFRHKKVRGESSSVVFAASVAALVGEAGISAYSATKGAIVSLTRALAIELAREKIRVNCVSPSIVKTEMTEKFHESFTPEQIQEIEARHPLGLGEPNDVAALVVFLLSDSARWITGSNLVVDGGYSAQ